MGKKHNIIEINGKRYDARTGELFDSSPHASVVQPSTDIVHPAETRQQSAQSIPVNHVASHTKPVHQAAAKKPAKVRVHDAVRQAAAAKPSHKPQPSKTLMRSAVKKPAPGLKRHIKAHSPADALITRSAAHIKPKASVHRLDDKRLRQAKNISKSQAINRFSKSRGLDPAPPTHVPVPEPRPHAGTAHHIPVRKQPAKHPQTTADLLEKALQQATSHLEIAPSAKKRRGPNRVLSLGALAAALIILGGFVAFRNIDNVKMHVASSKAGFAANLPDYQPAGYSLSHLNYAPGTVSIKYRSNTDERSYAITEKASAWNSDALRDSFLAASGHNYQTIETSGRTLFIYGENAATWVSGGVWYQVQSNGSLSSRQLVQLATSM